jgi:hypothetical protein
MGETAAAKVTRLEWVGVSCLGKHFSLVARGGKQAKEGISGQNKNQNSET